MAELDTGLQEKKDQSTGDWARVLDVLRGDVVYARCFLGFKLIYSSINIFKGKNYLVLRYGKMVVMTRGKEGRVHEWWIDARRVTV